MSDKTDELSVQLNEAFERLENQTSDVDDEPEDQKSNNPKSSGSSSGSSSGDDNSGTDSSTKSEPTADRPSRRSERSTASASRATANTDTKPNSIGTIISLLVGFIAIGIASFSAYTVLQIQSQNDVSSSANDATYSSTQDQIKEVRQALVRLEESTATQLTELDQTSSLNAEARSALISQLEQKIEVSTSELKSTIGTSSEDWLLAEAEYLIRLANQKVMMESDAKGAVALFIAADEIIANAQGIVAFDLRQAIAEDVAKLQSVAELDIEGIFVTVGALVKQVDYLQQRELQFNSNPDNSGLLVDDTTGFMARVERLVDKITSKLSNLVDYRNDGEVITPILPPEEEYYLRQNLTMTLRLTQLGLLRGNQQIYQDSLVDAKVWIAKYFDTENATTIAMMGTIEELKQVNVEQNMPNVSSSLREIKGLMASFHKAKPRQTSIDEAISIELEPVQ